MKVLLVFTNSSVKKDKAFPDDLQALLNDAAKKNGQDVQVFVTYARSLSYLISNEKTVIRDHRNHMNLEEYDLVYFRKAGAAMQQMQACAYYLLDRGIPFYDSELVKASSRNKLSQMVMLERHGLPIPATLFCRNKRRLKRMVTRKYAEYFPMPIIVKATGGSRGESNYLVHDYEELEKVVKDDSKRSFMIQQYVPNDGDYRFFVAGGRLRGIIGRKATGGSHLSNTSKGGSAVLLPHDEFGGEARTQAVMAAQIFGRDVAGVDIMFDKNSGKHYFLEVNRAPQIEHASFEEEKAEWMINAFVSTISNHQPMTPLTNDGERRFIGRFESVKILPSEDGAEKPTRVMAKIDTGADSSSVHCADAHVEDGILHFSVAGYKYAYDRFFIKRVKSSNGQLQERFFVEMPIQIGKERFTLKVTLNDRSDMKNTLLIGRRFLRQHRFIVDVTRRYILSGKDITG